jgi:hypothetical protein
VHPATSPLYEDRQSHRTGVTIQVSAGGRKAWTCQAKGPLWAKHGSRSCRSSRPALTKQSGGAMPAAIAPRTRNGAASPYTPRRRSYISSAPDPVSLVVEFPKNRGGDVRPHREALRAGGEELAIVRATFNTTPRLLECRMQTAHHAIGFLRLFLWNLRCHPVDVILRGHTRCRFSDESHDP